MQWLIRHRVSRSNFLIEFHGSSRQRTWPRLFMVAISRQTRLRRSLRCCQLARERGQAYASADRASESSQSRRTAKNRDTRGPSQSLAPLCDALRIIYRRPRILSVPREVFQQSDRCGGQDSRARSETIDNHSEISPHAFGCQLIDHPAALS
jgi:hypothetical protein